MNGSQATLRDALDVVQQRGWTALQVDTSQEFEILAHTLGTPRPSRSRAEVFERLRVLPRDRARRHSLSAQHGEGAFPFHTDTAHWAEPARYVLLRSETESSRPTRVVDLRDALNDPSMQGLFARAVFAIRDGRRSFLAPAWDARCQRLRFDRGCMLAANRAALKAAALMDTLVATASTASLEWIAGRTLLIDNWRCVHSRGVTADKDDAESRELVRALIEVG